MKYSLILAAMFAIFMALIVAALSAYEPDDTDCRAGAGECR